jgi:hypothetical protein
MTRTRWGLLGLGLTVFVGAARKGKKRARRARGAYHREVSAGSRPIEAVGTAVAAFVGIDQR